MTPTKNGKDRVLVLGGGGVAGIAWLIGMLSVFEEHEVDIAAECDHVLGTSAGATVGAYVAAERSLVELAEQQRSPVSESRDFVPPLDLATVMTIMELVAAPPTSSPDDDRRAIGQLALEASSVTEAERRDVIAWRLGTDEWPERPLTVTAVNVETGERVLFNSDSGVSLIDAVAASCAVPGVWPPVTIHDERFMDGGVYSPTNHDLITPTTRTVILRPGASDDTLDALPRRNRWVVCADENSLAAFGSNVLDPAVRAASLDAGRAQAQEVVDDLRAFWESATR